MEWKHLPLAGGLYDQHPAFIDNMITVMSVEAEVEKRKAQREKAKQARSKGASGASRKRR